MIDESSAAEVDVAQVLKDKHVDVLVSYSPVGSEEADKFCISSNEAGCAFVNCLPVFIASDPQWAQNSVMQAFLLWVTILKVRWVPLLRTVL